MSTAALLSLYQKPRAGLVCLIALYLTGTNMVVGCDRVQPIAAGNNGAATDSPAVAQVKPDTPPAKSSLKTDQDYAKRLPRIPARSPQESLASIRVRPGFRVELVASEPLIHDPVALEFDARGRMYVVELPQYNAYALKGVKLTGSVRLVEDRNADGLFDASTVFLDGLKYPTAVTCYDGGVFVGDAPDLLYAKDTDGDGRADIRRVVYTGFGSDKAGEAHLNSFRWGFDNRIHISTNLSGGDVRWLGKPLRKAVSVRSRGLIFDPRNPGAFELTSGGGQHGLSMDDWGRKFVCSNSVPAQTLMYDDRYAARNPLLVAPKPALDIAPQGKFTKLYRISPTEPWRALRTFMRSNGLFRGSDEGGKPFGFFTGATGITVYRGSAWPEEMCGNLLVGDVANNLVYRANLQPDGLRLVARRADPKAEFLASTDIWFRPVQLAHGPDGALYVLDMYRELIEGAAFLPPQILKHLRPTSGNDRGRIYRIVPQGFERPLVENLSNMSTAQLVARLEHRNGWHRDVASRLLYERQDRSEIELVRQTAQRSPLAVGRMTALYSLDGLNALQETDVLTALSDQEPRMRVHAIRLAEPLLDSSPVIRKRFVELVEDSDIRVRYQLAFSLGMLSSPIRNSALARLALKDAVDSWMRLAVLSALHSGSSQVFEQLVSDVDFRGSAHGRTFLEALCVQTGKSRQRSDTLGILGSIRQVAVVDKALSQRLLQKLVAGQTGALRQKLLAAAGSETTAMFDELLQTARQQAGDRRLETRARVDAIASLRLAPYDTNAGLFRELLTVSQPQQVQSAALTTLSSYQGPAVAKLVLQAWSALSPAPRATATETLLSRPMWVSLFLDAVRDGGVQRADISAARVKLLMQFPDPAIRKRVLALFGGDRSGERGKVVAAYQTALTSPGDAQRGKAVFKKVCSACHRLEDVGNQIGADLKAVGGRGLPAVLLNVLDPNREVKPQFLSYVVVTDVGRVIAGMIETENANSLKIRRPDGTTITLQRDQIEQLKSTGQSFMPEGLEKQIDIQAMSDLLRYLEQFK